MKKKNGFIATSIMFSFFLVFTALSMLVLASYAHFRVLINNLNGSILKDLNDNVISKKYTSLSNCITDGDFKSIKDDFDANPNNYQSEQQSSDNPAEQLWRRESYLKNYYKKFYDNWYKQDNNNYNAIPYYSFCSASDENADCSNDYYVRFLNKLNDKTTENKVRFAKQFDGKKIKNDNQYHKVYIYFRMFRNSKIDCDSGTVSIRIGQKTYTMSNEKILCGEFINWDVANSQIFDVYSDSEDQEIIFNIENFGLIGENGKNVLIDYCKSSKPEDQIKCYSTHYVNIRDIKVVDITSLYKKGTTDDEMKEYLDKNLPYIEENYPLARY